ncbi:aldo/keto reductase [Xylariaceae sp. FL0804]|nr:aldo/keto reductase [Xylariaceae sp. FL0804]
MSSPSIPLHPLGKNGPMVPALGFGLMGMSHRVYGPIQGDEERFKLLDRALELGATFWDTADLYGDNEELLGKWFRRTGKRDQIFLASKSGIVAGPDGLGPDSSAEYCKKSCERCLARLGIDSIDLYYMHTVNPDTPIEETMRALAELQAEGKIKHIGLSAVSSATLRRACRVAPVAAVQTFYSVFDRDIEGDEGTRLAGGVPAASSASPSWWRRRWPGGIITSPFGGGAGPAAGEPGADADDSRVKRIGYLEENWAALGVSLTDADEAEIRSFAEDNALAGAAVPDAFATWTFRDTREEEVK